MIETDLLKDNAIRASNKAALEAEAQADLEAFKRQLTIKNEGLKEKACKMADARLASAKRVASGSHRSSHPTPSHSTRPTPRLMINTLPAEIVPSSQTPPEMTLSPLTPTGPSPIELAEVPVPFTPNKCARSESTTPMPRDPLPPAPQLVAIVADVPAPPVVPASVPVVASVSEGPIDSLTAALAALAGQMQAINSRLDRIETKDES
jgi:hypothetical protein